jgi:hypothetical protein
MNLLPCRRSRVRVPSAASGISLVTGDFLPLRRGASARRGGVLGDFDHVLRSPLGVGFVAETKTLRYRRAHFPAR